MAGFEDAVRFASALGLDLPPTNKKMVLKEDFYEEAKQGQHLAVLIGENRHNPWHHVIYAGKEEGKGYVYHMTGDDKSTARIRKDLFSDFAKGRAEIAIVLYSDESDRTLQVQHAIAKCCHEHLPQENIYKVMNFNCEHFAVMCKTGKANSEQIDKLMEEVIVILKPVASVKTSAAATSDFLKKWSA